MRRMLSITADVMAPDGSEVRLLASTVGGSMAHFTLPPGQVSKAVRHRTVSEIWFILSGTGEMWFANDAGEEVLELRPGLSFDIQPHTTFQFRSTGEENLTAVAVTMPPWPGEDEAEHRPGKWQPKLP